MIKIYAIGILFIMFASNAEAGDPAVSKSFQKEFDCNLNLERDDETDSLNPIKVQEDLLGGLYSKFSFNILKRPLYA